MSSANPNFLLLGPEEAEKSEFIQKTIAQIAKKEDQPEIHRFYAFDTAVVDVVSLLQNGSLFSDYRVVILSNVEKIKKGDELSLLANYLKNPPPKAALFLLSDSIKNVSQKLSSAIPKQNVHKFWEMYENKRVNWIGAYFKARKIKIGGDATAFLMEMIQNNTRDLERECSRLASYFGEGSVLEIEKLEQFVYHSKEENVFTLFERLADRDLCASQEILAKILLSKDTDSTGILAGLLWQLRNLVKMKNMLESNYSLDETYSRLKVWSKKNQKVYMTAHRSYSKTEAQRIIMLVADFDMRLRSAGADLSRMLLELFLYYAVIRGGVTPAPPRF
jgi:DNA polymerase-3 subunit delta